MTHHIETPHMSQLQKSKLSVGNNSVDICFFMFCVIITNILVPGMFLFSSGILYLRKRIEVYKTELRTDELSDMCYVDI